MNEVVQIIRGQKVMLDSDLAMLYEVPTKRLNEAVKRNAQRFPIHYMFQLADTEWETLRSQFATSKESKGGRRYNPYVFTEQGVAMLSSVLSSEKAIQINIQIIDTFVRMRQWAIENQEMGKRLADLEKYLISHVKENRADFQKVYEALNLLMDRTKPNSIGFKTD